MFINCFNIYIIHIKLSKLCSYLVLLKLNFDSCYQVCKGCQSRGKTRPKLTCQRCKDSYHDHCLAGKIDYDQNRPWVKLFNFKSFIKLCIFLFFFFLVLPSL